MIRHILRLEMDLGDAAVVAGGQAVEDLGQPDARLLVDPAHDAEIDRDDRAVGLHEQIALVHVGVEIAGLDCLLEEGVDQPVGDRVQIMAGGDQRLAVRDLDAVDPVEGQHPPRSPVPVDRRDLVLVDLRHMLGKFRSAGGLAAQVQLAHRPAAEIGDDQLRAQALGLAAEGLEMGRRPFVGLDILGEFLDDAGAQHLDRNILALERGRAMDLGDRGGADRIRVDMAVQFVQRLAEAELDFFANLAEGHRWQAVLQLQQIARGRFADHVGPGCQRLAELDRGRADRLQCGRIIGLFWLDRAEPRDTEQSPDLRRSCLVSFQIAQRAVPRERAAPFEQA